MQISKLRQNSLLEKKDNSSVVPIHKNVVRNYANFDLYDADDKKEEDCLCWITVMEKCEGDLHTALKKDNLNLDERKKIATGIQAGFQYLKKIGWYAVIIRPAEPNYNHKKCGYNSANRKVKIYFERS